MRLVMLALTALALAGCDHEEVRPPPEEAMKAVIAFAREPSEANWAAVPFAEPVDLGLGETLRFSAYAVELRDPAFWKLSLDGFRAGAGTLSALELIAREHGPLRITSGPHRHCVSPPIAAPAAVASLKRISVQPREIESCLQWWTVDAFVDDDGEIRAVTFDLWEP